MRVSTPLCVIRPRSTAEVSAALRLASETAHSRWSRCRATPGSPGGAQGEGALMVSMERLSAIREIREADRVAVVEAGVVVQGAPGGGRGAGG